jgi:hypothetical protein
MAFTSANLDAIDAAIASGELTVSFNGRTVTYRSVGELLKARQTIASALAAQQPGAAQAGPARYFTFTTARGD